MQHIREVLRGIDTAAAEPGAAVPTGFAAVDRVLGGGLHRGRLYGIVGRPGSGTTILGVQLATRLALPGLPTLFVTSHDDPGHLALHAVRAAADTRLRGGAALPLDHELLVAARNRLDESELHLTRLPLNTRLDDLAGRYTDSLGAVVVDDADVLGNVDDVVQVLGAWCDDRRYVVVFTAPHGCVPVAPDGVRRPSTTWSRRVDATLAISYGHDREQPGRDDLQELGVVHNRHGWHTTCRVSLELGYGRLLDMEACSDLRPELVDVSQRRAGYGEGWIRLDHVMTQTSPTDQLPFVLPQALQAISDEPAIQLLKGYFDIPAVHAGAGFTGALFDTWDPTRTRAASADTFTPDDLQAVAFLSADIGTRAAIALLETQRARFEALLADLGPDRELVEVQETITPEWPARVLNRALLELPGIGPTRASKLIARKRPRLVPVYDAVINEAVLQSSGTLWEPMRLALRRDDGALHRRLVNLRAAAGLSEAISALRVFDVIAWREGVAARGGTVPVEP